MFQLRGTVQQINRKPLQAQSILEKNSMSNKEIN